MSDIRFLLDSKYPFCIAVSFITPKFRNFGSIKEYSIVVPIKYIGKLSSGYKLCEGYRDLADRVLNSREIAEVKELVIDQKLALIVNNKHGKIFDNPIKSLTLKSYLDNKNNKNNKNNTNKEIKHK